MPTDKPRFTITVDEELYQQITEYRFANRLKNQTQAVLSLIDKGLYALSGNAASSLPIYEDKYIKKYRALDEHGKKAVNAIIDVEYERCLEDDDTSEHLVAARGGQRVQVNPVDDIDELLTEDAYDK